MAEVDGGPCGARRTAGDGEDEEPGEEEEQDVGGPDPGVHEPLGVLVHVHRRRRLHVVGRPSPPHPRLVRRISGKRSGGRCRCADRRGGWSRWSSDGGVVVIWSPFGFVWFGLGGFGV